MVGATKVIATSPETVTFLVARMTAIPSLPLPAPISITRFVAVPRITFTERVMLWLGCELAKTYWKNPQPCPRKLSIWPVAAGVTITAPTGYSGSVSVGKTSRYQVVFSTKISFFKIADDTTPVGPGDPVHPVRLAASPV